MNIFYVTSVSGAGEPYLKRLQELSACKEMTILSSESLFLSPSALKLRSGDLILLFASNIQEFDTLLALKNDLSDFRIILILADDDNEMFRKAHLLRPSFIAFRDEKVVTIEAVIKKITETDRLSQKTNHRVNPV